MARARVMLFDVDRVSAERLVGIYRVLGEVDGPEHYARRLAVALHTTGHVFGHHGADMGLTLGRLTEAIRLCRGLDPAEHRDRDAVLRGILVTYQWALYRYDRRAEALAVRHEILTLARAGARTAAGAGGRWSLAEALLEVAVALVEDGRDDEAEPLFAEAVAVTDGLGRGYLPNADRHWYITAQAGRLATRGRFADAADAYRPLLETTHDDRQVPILLYGAHLLAAANRPAESGTVLARAVEAYRTRAAHSPTRGLRHDLLAHHLAVIGAADEPDDIAHATTSDHWSPTRLIRHTEAEPALRAALDAPTTTPAQRLVLERRLNVRATFAPMSRTAAARLLLPRYAKAVEHARSPAIAEPAVAKPLLARALTDHALLLAAVGRARDGIPAFEEAAALHS
ncbi:hypothetical protein ACFZBU_24255 [Embleya sp. NPDC008237]|uniref:hypothetical protein n=1 Tax=Embleya sp. NPDC008237 TaxID=3363978 RepID=UPI0036EAA07C